MKGLHFLDKLRRVNSKRTTLQRPSQLFESLVPFYARKERSSYFNGHVTIPNEDAKVSMSKTRLWQHPANYTVLLYHELCHATFQNIRRQVREVFAKAY
jgi:hypothetical protein